MRKDRYIMVLTNGVPGWPVVALVHLPAGTRWDKARAAIKRLLRRYNNNVAVRDGCDWFIDPAPGGEACDNDQDMIAEQRDFFDNGRTGGRFRYDNGEIITLRKDSITLTEA